MSKIKSFPFGKLTPAKQEWVNKHLLDYYLELAYNGKTDLTIPTEEQIKRTEKKLAKLIKEKKLFSVDEQDNKD